MLSRVLSGGRTLLLNGLAVTAAVCALGAVAGMTAAYRKGGAGFPDPTNFGKFFTRHIGTCPGAFRHIHQGQ